MDIDPEVLEKAKSEIPEFKPLFDEHTRLKHQVEELNKRPYLTPEEELEKKKFQKQKLICKDKLESMLETLEPEAS
ncbi:conserved hypothetical protein [Nitrospina gracilis 3/211]|uniref:DUF465 domain-containing protein n=1 Tax=Nitrospina gracilis (strain 3/211) TaxID=1266370 RepID=M1ZCN9_NITG3|nr:MULTISPECIES: YdcH family protein [Nitrospina]MCF8724007.1 uncharacterized protein YdcH (DUF465 family) [Nitrospina sp. Nb-3]CCQ91133.1 conserved hypothetical protein [Nitrospina gracilis 3/211]